MKQIEPGVSALWLSFVWEELGFLWQAGAAEQLHPGPLEAAGEVRELLGR